MAQFYTLEEAARVLGMSSEELKSKAQAREVRAFLDSGSWRFRVRLGARMEARHGVTMVGGRLVGEQFHVLFAHRA